MNLTTEIIRELLDYSPETGIFTWKERGREWFKSDGSYKRWNTLYAGRVSGYVHLEGAGYPSPRIRVLGKVYRASRLAFLSMGEELPEQVDHLSGDSLDNRWLNLQPSTNAENGRNRSMSRSNTSGVTGVTWDKSIGKWLAQIRLDGKTKHLGYFDDLEEAAEVVSEFYAANGFSARHGQSLSAYQVAVVH